jgi:hypothetical protein
MVYTASFAFFESLWEVSSSVPDGRRKRLTFHRRESPMYTFFSFPLSNGPEFVEHEDLSYCKIFLLSGHILFCPIEESQ